MCCVSTNVDVYATNSSMCYHSACRAPLSISTCDHQSQQPLAATADPAALGEWVLKVAPTSHMVVIVPTQLYHVSTHRVRPLDEWSPSHFSSEAVQPLCAYEHSSIEWVSATQEEQHLIVFACPAKYCCRGGDWSPPSPGSRWLLPACSRLRHRQLILLWLAFAVSYAIPSSQVPPQLKEKVGMGRASHVTYVRYGVDLDTIYCNTHVLERSIFFLSGCKAAYSQIKLTKVCYRYYGDVHTWEAVKRQQCE